MGAGNGDAGTGSFYTHLGVLRQHGNLVVKLLQVSSLLI